MDAERFQLLSRLFESAILLDPALRAPFVAAQCGDDAALRVELERLLAAHDAEESAGALLRTMTPPPSLAHAALPTPLGGQAVSPSVVAPPTVGRYRLIRPIASGGMGTVHLAEQDEPHRQVALKLLHPGVADEAIVRRFEREADFLARLRHPGIAHVYEIGTFDDGVGRRPFIAMELVEGVPIDEHVRRTRPTAKACLELVAEVADAVEHAHRAGIVHRDLKPANILVDRDGRPRVLDFGIARAIGDDTVAATLRTQTGQLLGTVPYMSPEQAAGRVDEIDVRTDVHALGVIAFELLAGRLPYDLAGRMPHEMLRVIREDEPTRLSSVDRSLRGDIETVVGHALSKEPVRRYQTAADFADDLRRAARGESVSARPPSRRYRAQVFVRRHRMLVVTTVLVMLALVVGMVATGIALLRALDAERLAAERLVRMTAEAEKAHAISRFLQEMLASVDPRFAVDPDLRMREVLDAAAARLDDSDSPLVSEVDAAIRHTLASTYRSLGEHESARRFGEEALRVRMALFGERHPETADTLAELAEIAREQGEFEMAETLAERALAARRALDPPAPAAVATSLNNLALVRRQQGRGEEAIALHEEALAIRRSVHSRDHTDVVTSLNNLSLAVFLERRDFDRAEALLREGIAMLRRMHPTGHVYLASSLDNLASLRSSRGDFAEAEILARESVELRRRLLPPDHDLLGEGLSNLGLLLRRQERFDEAEPLYRESLRIRRAAWPGDHESTATILNNLGNLLRIQGRLDEAEPLLREALEMRRRLFPDGHPMLALSLGNVGVLVLDRDPDEAVSRFAEAMEMVARLPGDRRIDEANYAASLAVAHERRGAFDDATLAIERSLELRRAVRGPTHPEVAHSLLGLGRIALARGDLSSAVTHHREAVATLDGLDAPPESLQRQAADLAAEIERAQASPPASP